MLCRSLAGRAGLDVRVLAFYSEKSRDKPGLYDEIRATGIPVDTLFDDMRTGVPLLTRCRAYFKARRPDVVQSFLEANRYVQLAGLGLPFRHWFGIRSLIRLSAPQRLLQRALDGRVGGYVGNAQAVTDLYCDQVGAAPGKRHVIRNGFELSRLEHGRSRESMRDELGLPADARVMITVSNMHFPFKGHADLLEAWADHAPKRPRDRLLLVGDGKLRAELEGSVERTGLADSVTFLGSRGDVLDLLRAADLYVSPSWIEGYSNAILEARLSGLPVVATAVGGNVELVEDGPDGALVPARTPAALAEAFDRDYLAPDAATVAALAEQVDPRLLGDRYLEIYAHAGLR